MLNPDGVALGNYRCSLMGFGNVLNQKSWKQARLRFEPPLAGYKSMGAAWVTRGKSISNRIGKRAPCWLLLWHPRAFFSYWRFHVWKCRLRRSTKWAAGTVEISCFFTKQKFREIFMIFRKTESKILFSTLKRHFQKYFPLLQKTFLFQRQISTKTRWSLERREEFWAACFQKAIRLKFHFITTRKTFVAFRTPRKHTGIIKKLIFRWRYYLSDLGENLARAIAEYYRKYPTL